MSAPSSGGQHNAGVIRFRLLLPDDLLGRQANSRLDDDSAFFEPTAVEIFYKFPAPGQIEATPKFLFEDVPTLNAAMLGFESAAVGTCRRQKERAGGSDL